jgi:predicted DNA-binding transcriptional regulator AlpA
MDEEVKTIYQMLSQKYKKQALNKKELSQELGISVSSINYYLSIGLNLPRYKKLNSKGMGGNGGKVLFPVSEVAKYLSETNKVS